MTHIIFIPIFIFSIFSIACAHVSPKNKPLKIIDAHLHARFDGKTHPWSGIPKTKESLLSEMKENGVIGAVSHTRKYDENYQDLSQYNIIQCAGIYAEKIELGRLEKGLKDRKFGCIKIYLGYVYQMASHPNYKPAYKLAEKYKVPVVFHTGDTSEKGALLKYAEPMDIDEVAVTHPNVTFVIAHLGNPWVETAAEIVYKNDNVYADISAFLVGELETRSENDVDELIVKPVRWAFQFIENPNKLMFGTDWPLVGMKPYITAIKKAIPEQYWEDVFYNNAAKVFKFSAPDISSQQ